VTERNIQWHEASRGLSATYSWANCFIPACIPVGISPNRLVCKNYGLAIPWLKSLMMFNRFDAIPACDGRTDRHLVIKNQNANVF